MTGDDGSQPPLGVAETMFPAASITSSFVVSPLRAAGALRERGVHVADVLRSHRGATSRAAAPATRSSGSTRRRRSAAYSLESSRSIGTSANSGSP